VAPAAGQHYLSSVQTMIYWTQCDGVTRSRGFPAHCEVQPHGWALKFAFFQGALHVPGTHTWPEVEFGEGKISRHVKFS